MTALFPALDRGHGNAQLGRHGPDAAEPLDDGVHLRIDARLGQTALSYSRGGSRAGGGGRGVRTFTAHTAILSS
ncbi:hypothetical protein AZA_90220 [Nitrospirillum viridazoti Y2]|nr:hypothetical protein AZA_90220 [Nitrospirillum amazonense Y2]